MLKPTLINIINNELAIAWNDGSESFFPAEFLRIHSPSAENIGEKDILGNHHGPTPKESHPDIQLTGFEQTGNYAIRLIFSDNHQTGLYSWQFLKDLEQKLHSKKEQ